MRACQPGAILVLGCADGHAVGREDVVERCEVNRLAVYEDAVEVKEGCEHGAERTSIVRDGAPSDGREQEARLSEPAVREQDPARR